MTENEWNQIIKGLNSDDGEVLVSAIERLDEASDESRVPDLLSLIESDDFVVREAAAEPLSRLQGVRVLPQLFHAITRGRNEGHDNDGLVSIVSSLLEKHQQESAPLLLDMIHSESVDNREHAAWAYGFLPAEIALVPLLSVRNDASQDVRSSVAGSLSSFPSSPDVLPVLLEMVEDDSEKVRISAASSLGYLGDKQAIPRLQEALDDPSERVRDFAKYSLERLGVKSKESISERITNFVKKLVR